MALFWHIVIYLSDLVSPCHGTLHFIIILYFRSCSENILYSRSCLEKILFFRFCPEEIFSHQKCFCPVLCCPGIKSRERNKSISKYFGVCWPLRKSKIMYLIITLTHRQSTSRKVDSVSQFFHWKQWKKKMMIISITMFHNNVYHRNHWINLTHWKMEDKTWSLFLSSWPSSNPP